VVEAMRDRWCLASRPAGKFILVGVPSDPISWCISARLWGRAIYGALDRPPIDNEGHVAFSVLVEYPARIDRDGSSRATRLRRYCAHDARQGAVPAWFCSP
jgi:hypothetical protein